MEDKIIVEKIQGMYVAADHFGKSLDPVPMTHDQMQKPHQKVRSAAGLSVGISLDESETLYDGAILWQDERVMIAISLIEEDVLEIRPFGNEEWAKTAFNIGNMHHPAYLYPTFIRVPYDPVIERLLAHLGVPVERKMAKLDGERAKAAATHSHGHTHTLSHGDSHEHTHEG